MVLLFFFFNDTATTEIYTLSLHDALPISFHFYLKEADHLEYHMISPIIKILDEKVAIATFYWLVILMNGKTRREIQGRGTHVFLKKEEGWKIIHEHFSRSFHQ